MVLDLFIFEFFAGSSKELDEQLQLGVEKLRELLSPSAEAGAPDW